MWRVLVVWAGRVLVCFMKNSWKWAINEIKCMYLCTIFCLRRLKHFHIMKHLRNPSSCLQLSLHVIIVQLSSHVWSWWWACEWGWRFCRWRFATVVLKELVWACTGFTAFFVYLTSWSMFFQIKSCSTVANKRWTVYPKVLLNFAQNCSNMLAIQKKCWWVTAKACLILLKIAQECSRFAHQNYSKDSKVIQTC